MKKKDREATAHHIQERSIEANDNKRSITYEKKPAAREKGPLFFLYWTADGDGLERTLACPPDQIDFRRYGGRTVGRAIGGIKTRIG